LILYDQNYNFLGISNETINFLGYEDIDEFTSLHSDFANLLVKKDGSIYNFKNFSWIDFILYSGSPNKDAIVKLKNGKEMEIKLSVTEIVFAKEHNGLQKCFAIKILSNDFVEVAGVSDKSILQNPKNDKSNLTSSPKAKPTLEDESKTKSLVTNNSDNSLNNIQNSNVDLSFLKNFQQNENSENRATIIQKHQQEHKEDNSIKLSLDLTKDDDSDINNKNQIIKQNSKESNEDIVLKVEKDNQNSNKDATLKIEKDNQNSNKDATLKIEKDNQNSQEEKNSNIDLNFFKNIKLNSIKENGNIDKVDEKKEESGFLKNIKSKKSNIFEDEMQSLDFFKNATLNSVDDEIDTTNSTIAKEELVIDTQISQESESFINLDFFKKPKKVQTDVNLTEDKDIEKDTETKVAFLKKDTLLDNLSEKKDKITSKIKEELKGDGMVELKFLNKLKKPNISLKQDDKDDYENEQKVDDNDLNSGFKLKYPPTSKEEKGDEKKDKIIKQIKDDLYIIDSDSKVENKKNIKKIDTQELEKFISKTKSNLTLFKSFLFENEYDKGLDIVKDIKSDADILDLNDIITSLKSIIDSTKSKENRSILNHINILEKKLNNLNTKIEGEAAFS